MSGWICETVYWWAKQLQYLSLGFSVFFRSVNTSYSRLKMEICDIISTWKIWKRERRIARIKGGAAEISNCIYMRCWIKPIHIIYVLRYCQWVWKHMFFSHFKWKPVKVKELNCDFTQIITGGIQPTVELVAESRFHKKCPRRGLIRGQWASCRNSFVLWPFFRVVFSCQCSQNPLRLEECHLFLTRWDLVVSAINTPNWL